jgi:hypothetical protein
MDIDTILTLYAVSKVRDIHTRAYGEFWMTLEYILDRIEATPSNRRAHAEKWGHVLLDEAARQTLELIDTGVEKLKTEIQRSGYPDRWLVPRKLGLLERLFPPKYTYEYEERNVY